MTDQIEANNIPNVPVDPYKEMEFDIFLKQIGNANLPNWSILAEALGVGRHTIKRWREHPLAKQAISSAIEENIRRMSEVGDSDWRMHREKLKMLGVEDKTTTKHEVGESVGDLINTIDKTDYGNVATEARKQVVAANPPVQNQEQAGPDSDVHPEPNPIAPPSGTGTPSVQPDSEVPARRGDDPIRY